MMFFQTLIITNRVGRNEIGSQIVRKNEFDYNKENVYEQKDSWSPESYLRIPRQDVGQEQPQTVDGGVSQENISPAD